jgi:hypothetical protein
MNYKWILFCPQLPATPSSPRVMVWRRMHSSGSVGLDNGLWILPYSDRSAKIIEEMKSYVLNQGGACKTFLANAFDEETETDIHSRFMHERAEEYFEFKEQCEDFLAEIEKETARKNFSFAEYEENEQDLEKLETWYAKVQARDFSGGDPAAEAAQWLEKCRQALQGFANEVIAAENHLRPGNALGHSLGNGVPPVKPDQN